MNLALRILSDVFCVALGCYISVLRDKNKRLAKHGEWIIRNVMSNDWFKLECPCCHKEFEAMVGDLDDYVLNYCPNCGSKNEFKEESE